jgi:hypothetical protein
MKPQKSTDKISQLMGNPKKIRDIIQAGINTALLKHKQAGNPVCESRNNKIVWIKPEDILTHQS